MVKMTKIAVTGNAGLLGSHLTEALQAQGHEVFGIDNLRSGSKENINCEFYKGDTGDLDRMNAVLGAEKPEVVYHLACTPYEGLSVFAPHDVTQNTFGNTTGILSASVKHGVRRFIYASSMSRYGKQEPPFTEDMTPAPEDPYAVAKVASEMLIHQMAETHGLEYAVAVPHNIIGVRQRYDDPYRNVASIMINRNLQGKPAIIYGDGEQQRCFSFVGDCISSLVQLMDCPSGEVYNIGPDEEDGEVVTINQLAEVVAEATGFEGEPVHYPDRPREVKRAYCSSDKVRRELGYETTVSLREGIAEMVEDVRKKGTKPFDYSFIKPEIVTDKTPETWVERRI